MKSPRRMQCDLKRDPRKRAAAEKAVAAIKDAMPAGLAAPALRALAAAGYRTLDDLRNVPEADLATLHGMGPKALEIIRAELRGKRGS